MRMLRLSDEDQLWLADQPESAMGVQIVRIPNKPRFALVVGGLVVLENMATPSEEGIPIADWMIAGSLEQRTTRFSTWYDQLDQFNGSISGGAVVAGRYNLIQNEWFDAPPRFPPSGFGHLPYSGVCEGEGVFYRWEAFPTSRRINQKTLDIKSGTFTAPASEVQFVASGFGAVGRFALPCLSPANWRWELRPPAGTTFRCGASVPLYGQSGGGVEVEFNQGFKNVGPIANPFILSPL